MHLGIQFKSLKIFCEPIQPAQALKGLIFILEVPSIQN